MAHQTIAGVDRELPDGIRLRVRDFLDVDPSLGRHDERGGLGRSVHEDAHVGLGIDVLRRRDENLLDRETRDGHAQNILGVPTDFGRRRGQLHATRLAPSARVDLRLHDHGPSILLREGHSLLGRGGNLSRGHRDSVGA